MQKDNPKFKAANVHNSHCTVSMHQKLVPMYIYTEQTCQNQQDKFWAKIEWEKGKVATGFRTNVSRYGTDVGCIEVMC